MVEASASDSGFMPYEVAAGSWISLVISLVSVMVVVTTGSWISLVISLVSVMVVVTTGSWTSLIWVTPGSWIVVVEITVIVLMQAGSQAKLMCKLVLTIFELRKSSTIVAHTCRVTSSWWLWWRCRGNWVRANGRLLSWLVTGCSIQLH
jgi:hypothetical protein